MAIISAYGLFWRRDEIDWNPGKGKRDSFRLLGRQGAYRPKLQLADFRHQIGIYILYGDYGPHYAGLTRETGFGKRLQDHLSDKHKNKWDRFSWFGFRRVLKRKNKEKIRVLGKMAQSRTMQTSTVVGDCEAMLIKAMALQNKANMNFCNAENWIQVKLDEVSRYVERAK